MGYSPWGLKELDTTEATQHAQEGRRQPGAGHHLSFDVTVHCRHSVRPLIAYD